MRTFMKHVKRISEFCIISAKLESFRTIFETFTLVELHCNFSTILCLCLQCIAGGYLTQKACRENRSGITVILISRTNG